jgi:hypothetical protein
MPLTIDVNMHRHLLLQQSVCQDGANCNGLAEVIYDCATQSQYYNPNLPVKLAFENSA